MAHQTARKHRHLNASTAWKAGYTAPSRTVRAGKKFPCRQSFKKPGA